MSLSLQARPTHVRPTPARQSGAFVLLCSLAALFVAAVALAAYNAGRLPLWYDEAITLLQLAGAPEPDWPSGAQAAATHKALFDDFARWDEIVPMLYETDVHPPLYYFAALAWSHLFGKELFDVRLFSLLCVVASGLVIAITVRRMGVIAVVSSATLFLFAPMAQWAAVNVRDYALAALLTTVAFCLAFRELAPSADNEGPVQATPDETIDPQASAWRIVGAAFFAALAFYTHYFSVLITAPVLLFLFLCRARSMPFTVLAAVALGLAMTAVIAPLALHQMSGRPHLFVGFQGLHTEGKAAARLFLTALSERLEPLWLGRIHLAGFLLVATGSAALMASRPRLRVLGAFLVFSLVLFAVLILSLFYATDKTLEGSFGRERYTMFILPPLVALVGCGLGLLARRQRLLAWAVFVLLLVPVAATWRDARIVHEPWTTADEVVPLVTQLSDVPPDRVLAVVPEGFGRGTPGAWAHTLDPANRMVVVAGPGDLEPALAEAKRVEKVLVVKDETHRLDAPMTRFEQALAGLGFSSEDGMLYRR